MSHQDLHFDGVSTIKTALPEVTFIVEWSGDWFMLHGNTPVKQEYGDKCCWQLVAEALHLIGIPVSLIEVGSSHFADPDEQVSDSEYLKVQLQHNPNLLPKRRVLSAADLGLEKNESPHHN